MYDAECEKLFGKVSETLVQCLFVDPVTQREALLQIEVVQGQLTNQLALFRLQGGNIFAIKIVRGR